MLNKKDIYDIERYLLIIGNVAALVIAIIIPFLSGDAGYYQSIQNNYIWVDVGYFLGLCTGIGFYLSRFLKLSALEWLTSKVKSEGDDEIENLDGKSEEENETEDEE